MKTVSIGEIAELNPRIPKKLGYSSDACVSFLPMAGVSQNGHINFYKERLMSSVIKGYRYFKQGDILLAKITPCLENGKAVFLDKVPHHTGFGSTEFHVIRPSSQVDGRYLFYMIWNPVFRKIASKNMTGTAGQRRIPTDFVKNFQIPLPPIAEQRRIAAILDKADAIRRKRQQAIALTEELLRSTFLDMFGDPVTNPMKWEVCRIKDIADVKTGKTPSRKNPENYGGTIRWVKTTELKDSIITDTEEYLTEKGADKMNIFPVHSILVAMYGQGATRGRTALLGSPCATNQACAIIIPNQDYFTIYLWILLRLSYKQIREMARGGNQPNLNLSMIKNFHLPLPPLEHQKRFALSVNTLSSQSNYLKKSLSQSNNLFNCLLQRAFKGEL